MRYPESIENLIQAFSKLPAIGSRSAARLTMHLLEKDRASGLDLAQKITQAMNKITNCSKCFNFCEGDLCPVCKNTDRDQSLLCVVSTPMEVMSVEQSASFRGNYFVLMGVLSPLDGIGPADLKFEQLETRLQDTQVKEVIFALAPTPEGDATCHYAYQLAVKYGKKVTRISYGIPFGGSVDYADVNTLSHAIETRVLF